MTNDRTSKRDGDGSEAGVVAPGRAARVAWAWRSSVVLLVVWLLLSGLEAWRVGALVALAGGVAGALLAPGVASPWRPWRLPGFFGYFLKASLLGGLDVAGRVFARRVDVQPCFAHYRISLPPGPPRTLMVSLVSLLPGTLSADLDAGSRRLLVHALAPAALDTLAGLEQRIATLYGLQVPIGLPQPLSAEEVA